MKKEDEIWKDIPGYEGLYQVSTMGRIKSYDRYRNCGFKGGIKALLKGRVLNPITDPNGYVVSVIVDKNGNKIRCMLHRLIMITFKNKDGFSIKRNKDHRYIQVDHINGLKNDNRLENLQYISASDNMKKTFNQGNKAWLKGKGDLMIERGYIIRDNNGRFKSIKKIID